jgi:hypothetical protein
MNGNLTIKKLDEFMKAAAPIAGRSDSGGRTFTLSSAGTQAFSGLTRECSDTTLDVRPTSSEAHLKLFALRCRPYGYLPASEVVPLGRQKWLLGQHHWL